MDLCYDKERGVAVNTVKSYNVQRKIEVIELSELPGLLSTMDVGDVRHPIFEVNKRVLPAFGAHDERKTRLVKYYMEPYENLEKYVQNAFIDRELKRIKNTPLSFDDAVEQFSVQLLESRVMPTHVVRVGTGIYAVISLDVMELKVGMVNGDPAAVLINTFDLFPVFRIK